MISEFDILQSQQAAFCLSSQYWKRKKICTVNGRFFQKKTDYKTNCGTVSKMNNGKSQKNRPEIVHIILRSLSNKLLLLRVHGEICHTRPQIRVTGLRPETKLFKTNCLLFL